MRGIFKRIVAVILLAVIGFGCVSTNTYAKSDYSKYSNTKKSWYIVRSDRHKASRGPETAKKLKKYNAYYYDNKTKEKVIYLTFDCGYEAGYTKGMLDVLKKHKVKATFFVTKQFVKTSAKLCKRMKKEGHIVGNHSMNHPSLPELSLDGFEKEVAGLEDYFKEKTGYKLDSYIRPPRGEYSNRTLKILKDMGYTSVFWSIAYYDYNQNEQPGKAYVVDHFKKYHHKGAITLTHNTSKSNAEALDTVITNLKKKGYRFALVSELE